MGNEVLGASRLGWWCRGEGSGRLGTPCENRRPPASYTRRPINTWFTPQCGAAPLGSLPLATTLCPSLTATAATPTGRSTSYSHPLVIRLQIHNIKGSFHLNCYIAVFLVLCLELQVQLIFGATRDMKRGT